MKYFFNRRIDSNNFSPLDKGEREGVVSAVTTPPNLPSYEGRKSAGFTIIELLVAIGIFSIIITIITGVFSRFMLIERHSIAGGQLITDVRSGMESITKEVRTGYGSTYSVTPGGTSNTLAFRNQSGNCVWYQEVGGLLQRAEAANVGGACDPNNPSAQFSPLTGSQTDIKNMHFNPVIARSSGGKLLNQGVVTVSITASSKRGDVQLPVELQNSITSRQTSLYVPK